MAESESRRLSDPRFVRKLHSAIKKICEQKQSPIFDRIFRALTIDKVQVTRSRVELQLKNAVQDGIILESPSGTNGKNSFGINLSSSNSSTASSGDKNTSYRIPSCKTFQETYGDDPHDWYCWVCHREGEVFMCSHCPRVIHKKCAELTSEDLQDEFICYCCKDLESTKQYGKKELQELSVMLGYTVDRMKCKCEELWKSPSEDVEATYPLFIFKDTNLLDLEKRVKKREFDSLAKFHYEIEWLFHNTVIFFGGDHKLTNLARMVVLDGQNELSQIDICSDCYIKSNDRPKNWFSYPCKVPHRIVYAKLGSDPHWPAKVLRENEDATNLDVRFFGPPHQRAWIPLRNILELKDKPTHKKRTKALAQAEQELAAYTKLLKKCRTAPQQRSSVSEEESVEEEIDDHEDENISQHQDHSPDEEEEEDEAGYLPSKKKKAPLKSSETSSSKKKKNTVSRRNKAAEIRFKEMQKQRLAEIERKKKIKATETPKKVDINKNGIDDSEEGGSESEEEEEDSTNLAQQIKMTDDYKMIEKLQERIRQSDKTMEQTKRECETAQTDLESTRLELAAERQKCIKLHEQYEKGNEVGLDKLRRELMLKKHDEIEVAVEEERKRNEMEFEVRLNEALAEERANAESKLQETVEKERNQMEEKMKAIKQHERDDMQRTFDRYKHELEMKQQRTLEESRSVKMEAEELAKRTIQENYHRLQVESERLVAATKKKSWCSNCTKEAFYHCCWNTNYCSTECQRVHWVSHRYQCTREMMATCRTCQQRQQFPPPGAGNFAPQVPPK